MDSRLRAPSDPDQHLEQMLRQLAASSPELYRQLALYLQVLRQGLLASVQQACFTLATRHADAPYTRLPSQRRRELHRRITSLVQRCTSLLTVEQLAVLGDQLERQRRRSWRRRQQQLIAAIEHSQGQRQGPLPNPGGVAGGEPGGPDQRGDLPGDLPGDLSRAPQGDRPAPGVDALPDLSGSDARLPPGSVRLDLAPPLTADLFTHGLPPLGAAGSPGEASDQDAEGPPELQALMALALESGEDDESLEPSWPGLLPHDPIALLAWWDRFDQALQRRLRNLSHALNVELLRIGLIRSLLPVHLLDAVLAGQIEPLSAPPNLLRLQLPAGKVEKAAPLEVHALLLRCSDLEYERPRLRTCRQRLRQQHKTLRRMAQHYRHWQRRAQVLEAEQLWLQDTGTNGPGPSQAD